MPSGRKPAPVRAAEVPQRALRDPRLSAGDLRLLAAIGHHDPHGAYGFGCTLDHCQLATAARLSRCDIPGLIKRLNLLGYISLEPRRDDGRRVTLRVRR